MKQKLFIFSLLVAFTSVFSQHSATITVQDATTSSAISGAKVTLNGVDATTSATGEAVFTGLENGNYPFTVSDVCYVTGTGSIAISDANATQTTTIGLQTVNDVNVSLSNFGNPSGFTINLTDGGSYNETIASGDELGNVFTAVPYGTYTYRITKKCYETATGTVTVDCNSGDHNFISVIPKLQTTNNVLFFVGLVQQQNCKITLTNTDTFEQLTITGTNILGDYEFDNVPYGPYTYEISKDCYVTKTGSLTVNCNNGNGIGVSVSALSLQTTNAVIFAFGGLSFNPSGLTINLKAAGEGTYDATIQSGNPLGDGFYDVPYGEYDYTVTGSPCFGALSGHVTVDCNEGEGVLISDNLISIVIDTTVTQEGNVLTANLSGEGVTYKWFNAVTFAQVSTEQTFTATVNGTYFVKIILGDGACNKNSAIYTVTTAPIQYSATITVNDSVSSQPVEGAQVELNNITLTTNSTGQVVFTNLVDDTYSYSIKKTCYADVNTSLIIDGSDITEVKTLTAQTTNAVLVRFSGLNFNPSGLTINLKATGEGTYDETIQSGNPLGDDFNDVPYGEYDYTVTGSPCFEVLSGHLTVDCNGGEGVLISDHLTSIVIDTTVTQEGNVLTANLSGEGITYKWYNAVTFAQVGTEQTFTATANGTYFVKIIIGDGACNRNSAVYTVSSLGIEDNIATSFTIYPNPAENDFVIEMNYVYQKTSVQITNLNGQTVFRGNYFDTKNINMNVSNLSAGFYIININADNTLISKKFIKR